MKPSEAATKSVQKLLETCENNQWLLTLLGVLKTFEDKTFKTNEMIGIGGLNPSETY